MVSPKSLIFAQRKGNMGLNPLISIKLCYYIVIHLPHVAQKNKSYGTINITNR